MLKAKPLINPEGFSGNPTAFIAADLVAVSTKSKDGSMLSRLYKLEENINSMFLLSTKWKLDAQSGRYKVASEALRNSDWANVIKVKMDQFMIDKEHRPKIKDPDKSTTSPELQTKSHLVEAYDRNEYFFLVLPISIQRALISAISENHVERRQKSIQTGTKTKDEDLTKDCNFDGLPLCLGDFHGFNFTNSTFKNANLSFGDFSDADFRGTDCQEAILERVNFSRIKTDTKTNFAGTIFESCPQFAPLCTGKIFETAVKVLATVVSQEDSKKFDQFLQERKIEKLDLDITRSVKQQQTDLKTLLMKFIADFGGNINPIAPGLKTGGRINKELYNTCMFILRYSGLFEEQTVQQVMDEIILDAIRDRVVANQPPQTIEAARLLWAAPKVTKDQPLLHGYPLPSSPFPPPSAASTKKKAPTGRGGTSSQPSSTSRSS